MIANTERIAAAALALPEDDRLELTDRLIESLDGPPDDDVERAWPMRLPAAWRKSAPVKW